MELLKTAPVSIVVLREHCCTHLSGNAAAWRVILGLFAGYFLGRCERPFFSGLHADPHLSIKHGSGCTISFWERRPQTIFSPFQCHYRETEAHGVWLPSCVAARWGLVLLTILRWLALLSGRGEGEEVGKSRLWGFPRGECAHLLVYSYLQFRGRLWPSGFPVPGELSVFFQLLWFTLGGKCVAFT